MYLFVLLGLSFGNIPGELRVLIKSEVLQVIFGYIRVYTITVWNNDSSVHLLNKIRDIETL